ncbi:MAG: fibronectin type III domain-containing protein [Verrucomicrobiae bacterium]|nr:fibronectin type III domain-containing protein [Verrucomicrobiae bacterium]
MRHHSKFTFTPLLTIVGLLLSGASGKSQIAYETRVFTGDPAPGTGAVFSATIFGGNFPLGFSDVSINAAGQITFQGFVTGDGVDGANYEGVWSDGGGTLRLVARRGDAAPGSDGIFALECCNALFVAGINESGSTFLRSTISGASSSNGRGIWTNRTGALSLLAKVGDAAPGTSASFAQVFDPVFNRNGDVSFIGRIGGAGVDPSNEQGIWSDKSGNLSLLARTGSPAPGTDAVFGGFFAALLNNNGQSVFTATLTGPTVDVTNHTGIWSDRDGSLALIVRAGQHAPGTGAAFGRIAAVGHLNGLSQIAFAVDLKGEDVDDRSIESVWTEAGGTLRLIARMGNPAPGTGPGVEFDDLNSLPPFINNAGQTFFRGRLRGTGIDDTNDEGMWIDTGGSTALVARRGQQAPGVGTGVVFADLAPDGSDDRRLFNNAGQVAFEAELGGAGVDPSNRKAIFISDRDARLMLVAREGTPFDVDDSSGEDFRTILRIGQLGFSGSEDGIPSGLNDAGQLAFELSFTDGSSGVFVANTAGASVAPGSLAVTSIVRNPNNTVTLSWKSDPDAGTTYTVRYTPDLQGGWSTWTSDSTSVPTGGAATTYTTARAFPEGTMFFTVEENSSRQL